MPEPLTAAFVAARLSALKQATLAAHRAIELRSPLARLIQPEVTLQDYGLALQRLHLHFSRHEEAVMRALQDHVPPPQLAQRRTLAALKADLTDLGLTAPEATCATPPPSPASAAGWLYVHEGTSLGGMVLLRHLRQALGAGLGTATRHYARHGRGTAARWQETRRMIAGLLPDDAALAQALAGAMAAFAAMDAVMTDPKEEPRPAATPSPGPKSAGRCPFAGGQTGMAARS
ncbi:heme oxygenase [Rhodobacter viridis]|uniref:Heme oxygenase n=1 Tax=Rhodobacter viridis TaxID=1054202 RepID=A0A318TVR1_9RHOB|nr:biliverdin-producing heme oxygenase [Rhodobacter viridis]PYF06025.1 heme oxygenase [Rhodobacter viridis]